MLDTYCSNVLARELRGPDYDGLTADQAWAWLTQPAVTTSDEDTHLPLTPLVAARVLGPVKANAVAAKVAASLPAIAASLMSSGVDLSDPTTAGFLASLVDGASVLAADVQALVALGKRTVTTTAPPRMDRRFDPARWPHVAADGGEGSESDPAIHGFPNALGRADFDACWALAGRS